MALFIACPRLTSINYPPQSHVSAFCIGRSASETARAPWADPPSFESALKMPTSRYLITHCVTVTCLKAATHFAYTLFAARPKPCFVESSSMLKRGL